MGRLSTEICGIQLDNPVIPASGTFGFGHEFAELYDLDILGSISIKGTTRDPRFGNETPRIAEAPSGIINAVGLQNPGVEAVISEELPQLFRVFHKPVMANVSGFSIEDYVYTCEKFDQVPQIGWLELNISCPNVHGGGMAFGTDPHMAAKVTEAVKTRVKKPVIVKLSPNVRDIKEIARACRDAGADGLSLINTILSMRIDLKRKKPVIANTFGGLSGAAILPISLRMVYEVAEAVDIPIIGVGGITTAEDVLEMIMAGASAVQVGAANLVDPWACKKIIEALPIAMNALCIDNIQSAIGAAHGSYK